MLFSYPSLVCLKLVYVCFSGFLVDVEPAIYGSAGKVHASHRLLLQRFQFSELCQKFGIVFKERCVPEVQAWFAYAKLRSKWS